MSTSPKSIEQIMKENRQGAAPGYAVLAENTAEKVARWGTEKSDDVFRPTLVGPMGSDSDRLDSIGQALWVLAAQVGRIADVLEKDGE